MAEIYFQASIVIFADAAGNEIYNGLHNSCLLERIHAPLRDGIGFICCETTETGPAYTCRLLKDGKELVEQFNSLNDQDVIKDAIEYMNGRLSTHDANRKGYTIVNDISTIYVVGSPEARHVVNDLRDRGVWNDISCLFLYEPGEQQQKGEQAADISSDEHGSTQVENAMPSTEEWAIWAQEKRVTFCYFYGDVSRKAYEAWKKPAFQYAAVEALFALITTGITGHSRFKQLVQGKPNVPFRHGTLSTCIVSVPRKEIRAACHAKVSALLLDTWFKHIETRTTGQEVKAGTEIEAEKQLAKIRRMVERPGASPQPPRLPIPFVWFRFSINGKQRPPLEQHLWMPLAACQEDSFQGEEWYEAQRQKLLEHTKAIFQHVTQEKLRDREWVEKVQMRHREMLGAGKEILDSKKQWLSTVESIWNKLREVASRNLLAEIAQQLSTHGLSWTIAYCQQLQSKLTELHVQIERETLVSMSEMGDEAQQETSQHTDDALPQDEQVNEGKLCDDIKEAIYMTPSFNTFTAVTVVAALTLALPVWLLASVFTGKLPLLLFVFFVLCLILVALGCWLYRRSEYIVPLQKKQQELLHLYYEKLVVGFEEKERAECKALIEALEGVLSYHTQVIRLVEPVVKGLVEDFEYEAKKPIERLFKISRERGQRACYVGSGIYLQNEDQALQTLGLTLKNVHPSSLAFSSIKTPVARIYENIVGKDSINLIKPGGIFANTEAYLWGAFGDHKSSPEELSKELRRLLEGGARSPLAKERGTYLSSSDFKFDVNDRSLWERMLRSLTSPPLCQFQQGSYPQAVFLCASRGVGYIASAKKYLTKGNLIVEDIEMHSSAGVEEKPFSDTSPWILLAGLYTFPASLRVISESLSDSEATQQPMLGDEATQSSPVQGEAVSEAVIESQASPESVVESGTTQVPLTENEVEKR